MLLALQLTTDAVFSSPENELRVASQMTWSSYNKVSSTLKEFCCAIADRCNPFFFPSLKAKCSDV